MKKCNLIVVIYRSNPKVPPFVLEEYHLCCWRFLLLIRLPTPLHGWLRSGNRKEVFVVDSEKNHVRASLFRGIISLDVRFMSNHAYFTAQDNLFALISS